MSAVSVQAKQLENLFRVLLLFIVHKLRFASLTLQFIELFMDWATPTSGYLNDLLCLRPIRFDGDVNRFETKITQKANSINLVERSLSQ